MLHRICRPILLASTLALTALVPAADATIIANPGCVNDVSGGSGNCTANDVTFVLVGLGVQNDGCVSGDPAESVSIFLGATLRNSTANTRYDIGMYAANDGDPNGDGALTGGCARQHLTPVGATGVTTCGAGALDLDGPASGVDNNVVGVADGPYLNAEAGTNNSTSDNCGDLFTDNASGCDENGDGDWDDTILRFPTAVAFPCRDIENDGFVNIPTCATWGQNANEVDLNNNNTCDSEAEVVPGTPAKCSCADTNTTIPRPNLALSCSCTPTTVQPGQSATCTVTYTNNQVCTPDLATPERFRCGTASFVRYKVDYDEASGSVSGISTTGTGTTVDDGTQIIWTPRSTAGTLGIIGQGQTSTLTYQYTVGPTPAPTVTIQTRAFWSDVSSFSPEVLQTALTCGVTLTTPVTLASAAARWKDDHAEVSWTTATEAGNAGFHLYTEIGGEWVRVNDELIPSKGVDSTEPLSYRQVVDGPVGGRFAIEEVAVDGRTQRHPAFALGESKGRKLEVERIDWSPIAAAKQAAESRARAHGPDAGSDTAVRSIGAAAKGGQRAAAELRVSSDGIHRVSHDQLLAAGVDFGGLQARQLALSSGGRTVPMRVVSGGRFGAGDYVEFSGRAIDTLYTDTNVYTLRVDQQAAARVTVDAAGPAGAPAPFYLETGVFERERGYSFGTVTDDPWFDTQLFATGAPVARSVSFTIQDLEAGAAPSVLTVDLWGSTEAPQNPDHHIALALNGVALADETFDGRVPHTMTVALPPGVLVEGNNVLTVTALADLGVGFDIVYLDGFQVEYPRRFVARDGRLRFTAAGDSFRVTGLPSSEVVVYRLGAGGAELLTGAAVEPDGAGFAVRFPGSPAAAEYLVSTVGALRVPEAVPARPFTDITSGQADYVILTHPLFLGSLDPLVTMHESRGLAVRVVDVEDVYDQFGGGVFGPEPIAGYIAHAVAAMGTRYVLLVGGDTIDYRGYLGGGSVSFLPTIYARTGELISFAPADSAYADLDGDAVPEVAIGRLPARSLGELDVLIGKTLAYAGKDYDRTTVLAADVFSGVSFSGAAENFQEAIGPGWDVKRAYIDWIGTGGARQLLLDSINDGVALTTFVGHSGLTVWTFSGLFTSGDAGALTNAGRPTVAVQWGCWNTYHVQPSYNTVGQKLLLSGDRGAAAVLGSATLMETTSAEAFSRYLAPLIAQPGTTLGDAVRIAKEQLAYGHPDLLDVLLGWTLLGDPGIVVEP